ncbi:MAG: hypothetical protein PWR10_1503 [Halanaerobiales bacterium]|nr:hypothetical protein [Halanaerobiales bacterium]
MLLSVCMVVRDGVSFISRALNSIKDLADEIIVVDTGSYDGTMQIAREYGAAVYTYQWNYDFSQARNYALKQAKGKWVLFLEANEELGNDYHQLRPLLRVAENDGFYLPVIDLNFSEEIYLPRLTLRLFQRKEGIYFQGRVNEEVSQSILEKNENAKIKILQLPIIHQSLHGTGDDLDQELKPTDLYYLEVSEEIDLDKLKFFYLRNGINFFWEGKLTLALNELEKGLEEAKRKDQLAFLKNIILILLELKQYKRAEEMIQRGMTNFSFDLIFNFWQGFLHYKLRKHQQGIICLKNILSGRISPKIKVNTYLLLGLSCKELGRKEEARFYLEKAYRRLPDNRLILSNLIEVLPLEGGMEVLDYLAGKVSVDKQRLAFLLLKTYYQRQEYDEALKLLDYLAANQENQDEFLYWRGKILLHLREFKEAARVLKAVSPGFSRFREVLDLLWVTNLSMPSRVESKSIINQIKLAGDKLAWNIIKLFNEIYFYGRDVWIEFDNLVAKLRFYRRALYYLRLLVEYKDNKPVKIMLEIINKMNIKSMAGDLGRLFYRQHKWDQAYYYLQQSLKQGEILTELIYLADTCYHLGRYEESKAVYQKVARLDDYQYIANNKLE